MTPSGSASSTELALYRSILELTKPSPWCLTAAPPGPVQETARSGSDHLNRLRKRPVFFHRIIRWDEGARLVSQSAASPFHGA